MSVDLRQYASEHLLPSLTSLESVPLRLTAQDVEKMLRDETIGAGLDILSNTTLGMIGDYFNPVEELQNFVRANFEQARYSIRQQLHNLLTSYFAWGISVAEILWAIKQDKVYFKGLIPLDITRVSFVTEKDENNKQILTAVKYQQPGEVVEIPVEKCLILFRGSIFAPKSVLARIYPRFKMKDMLVKYWATAMERFAAPAILGKTVSDTQALADALKNLYRNGVVAIYKDDEVQLLESSRNIGDVFQQAIEYLNTLILRGLLIPQAIMKQDKVGSYALAKSHLDVFRSVAAAEANYVAELLIDQLVARILDYNFSNIESYGFFKIREDKDIEAKQAMTDIIVKLLEVGVLDLVADAEFIRSELNLPKLEE